MSNKTPYEVRLSVLEMAKEYMDKQYEINTQFAEKAMEMWKESGKDVQEYLREVTPKQYTPEALLEQANRFYSFIAEKK